MKSKYSTTLCLLCGAHFAKGAEIRKVGGAWVHGRCPRHDCTNFSAPAKVGPKRSNTMSGNNQQAAVAAPQYATKAQFDMESNVSENEMPSNNLSDYLDRLEKSAGSNRDTDGLGTMAAGPFVVGSVEAINGEDGKEAPEFVATRHELKQLAEYWALERIEHDFDWFVDQTAGSSEWRWSMYVNRRLNRLAQVLGSEAMSKVNEQAVQAFRKHYPKISDADWRVFTEGTQEEQDAWRAKVFGEGEDQDGSERAGAGEQR